MTKEFSEIYPTENEKEDAKILFDKYSEGEFETSLEDRVRKKEEESGVKTSHWKNVNYPGKSHGISFQSIGQKRIALKLIKNGASLEALRNKSSFKPNSFRKAIVQCQQTHKAAIEYISNPKKGILDFKETTSSRSQRNHKNQLAETRWAAYFLYYKEDNSHEEVNEALIGRAIVTIKDSNEIERPVLFENIELDSVINYAGTYSCHTDLDHGIVIFELEPYDSRERARNIHIKVYCRDKDQQILLGQYTTYEKGYIQSGNIIFSNLKDQKELETGLYSFIYNEDLYNKDNIPDSFRLFLSQRLTNYNILKYHDIRTERALQKHVDNYRPSDNSTHSRFLERYSPRVFISIATSGNSKSIAQLFQKGIEDAFNGKLKVSYKKGHLPNQDESSGLDTRGQRQPFRDIEKLKTTRFFILILDDVRQLSYSHVQLGVALVSCKFCIVVTKRELLSKSLIDMRRSVLEKIYYTDDLSNELDLIISKTIRYIKKWIPKNLDGNIEVR